MMTEEQDERLKRIEALLMQLLQALSSEEEEEPTSTSLDGTVTTKARDQCTPL